MNNARRKTISRSLDSMVSVLPVLKETLEAEKTSLSSIPDDEDNYERREAVEEVIDNLGNAISSLEEAINSLEGADF